MRRAIVALVLTLGPAELALAATLAGAVTDSATGRPIANARIEVLGSLLTTTTGEDGAFSLEVPAWPVTLVVTQAGYRVARLALEGPPAGPLEVRVDPIISYSDRIEVTAARAREGVDPATFTNLPQERVMESYWGQDPAMLLPDLTPGFFAYNDSGNGIGYSYFTVRGFGQARTRVTLNGAPLNDAESGELFFIDLADFLSTSGDIQLGRGVFGLSGIGGALDITTAPPSLEPSFTLQGYAGSFGTGRFTARFDSGLIRGTWNVTARYSKTRTDGYRDQSWVDQWNSSLSLSRFGSRSTLRLNMFGGPEKTHLAYEGVPKSVIDGGLTGDADRDRRTNPIAYPGELDQFVQPHFQLLHDLQIGTGTHLAQTFYAFRGDGFYEQLRRERTLAEYNLPDVSLPDGTTIEKSDLIRKRTVGEWDGGWVPTLTHRRGSVTLTVTGELRLHDAHHTGEVKWAQFYPVGVEPDQRYYDYRVRKDTETGAVRLAWKTHPRLTLSAGLQLTHEAYRLSEDRIKSVSLDQGYAFVLPRAGAIVLLAKDAEAYLNVARGGRAPNARQIYDPQDYYSVPAVGLDPEDVIDYEAGLSVRRGVWRARVNAFFMDFRNEIVYAGALDDNGVPVYGNGARSHHRGVEAEGSWSPSRRLGLEGHLTLSRNTFTDYSEFGWDGGVVSYDGNKIAGYPEVMGALTARTALGPVRLSVTARHVGLFYVDNTEDNRKDPAARAEAGYVRRANPAYTAVDATIRVAPPLPWARKLGASKLELELRVNNLLDRRYTAFGYVDGEPLFIPAATRAAYAGVVLGL
jgi:iron complex outermembrane receptor protein